MESTWTIVSILSSVASLVLAVVAIWIALHMKDKADETNQKTHEILTEVRSDAKSIVQYAMPELQKYGDSVRQFAFQKEGTDPDAIPPKIEEALEQMKTTFEEQITAIRSDTDPSGIRKKLERLETQLAASQENIRESVKESKSALLIYQPHEDRVTAISSIAAVLRFVGMMNARWGPYGEDWIMRDRVTGKALRQDWWRDSFEDIRSHHPKGLKIELTIDL